MRYSSRRCLFSGHVPQNRSMRILQGFVYYLAIQGERRVVQPAYLLSPSRVYSPHPAYSRLPTYFPAPLHGTPRRRHDVMKGIRGTSPLAKIPVMFVQFLRHPAYSLSAPVPGLHSAPDLQLPGPTQRSTAVAAPRHGGTTSNIGGASSRSQSCCFSYGILSVDIPGRRPRSFV